MDGCGIIIIQRESFEDSGEVTSTVRPSFSFFRNICSFDNYFKKFIFLKISSFKLKEGEISSTSIRGQINGLNSGENGLRIYNMSRCTSIGPKFNPNVSEI